MMPTAEPASPHMASVGNADISSANPTIAAPKTAITGLNKAVDARVDARFRDRSSFQKRWLQSRQRTGRIQKAPNAFSRSDLRRDK
jgi:hypothetical protein